MTAATLTRAPNFDSVRGSGSHALFTGPIRDDIELEDGTVVDVRPGVVYLDTPEQVQEVSHKIGLWYEEYGHPSLDRGAQFMHHCTHLCGEHARDITDPAAAAAAEYAQRQTDGILDAEVRYHHAEHLGTGAGDNQSNALASVTAENAALSGLIGTGATNVMPDVSLHSASPSTTGANENANSGSYARQACSWNAPSGGTMTNSTSLTFSTLGTVAVTHYGTWSSATYGAGTYALGGALTASVTSASITFAAGAITTSAT